MTPGVEWCGPQQARDVRTVPEKRALIRHRGPGRQAPLPGHDSAYDAKTRGHPAANYFGNSKLWASKAKITWIELAFLTGADGVCGDKGPVPAGGTRSRDGYR